MRWTYLPVDSDGVVQPEAVQRAITDKTTLVSIMYANNEIGVVNPIPEIAQVIRRRAAELSRTILFHSDAVQAAGYLDLDVRMLGVDLLSLSGHKFHGPKGTGVLFIRRGAPFLPYLLGGGQERERRSGTENIPGIVGLSVALEAANARREETGRHCAELRDRVVAEVLERVPGSRLNGHPTREAPQQCQLLLPRGGGEESPSCWGWIWPVSPPRAGVPAVPDPSSRLTCCWAPGPVGRGPPRGSLRLTLGKDNTEGTGRLSYRRAGWPGGEASGTAQSHHRRLMIPGLPGAYNSDADHRGYSNSQNSPPRSVSLASRRPDGGRTDRLRIRVIQPGAIQERTNAALQRGQRGTHAGAPVLHL